jgi:hypothetical protein
VLVAAVGWAPFFFLTFLIALPGLVLLWWLRDTIHHSPFTVFRGG